MRKRTISMFLIVCSLIVSCGKQQSGQQSPTQSNASNQNVSPEQKSPTTSQAKSANQQPVASLPQKVDHIVIVIEENRSFHDVIGNPEAPYINALTKQGAYFTNYHAIEHPSQPNYLDLFSGSNQGVTDDSCPHTFSTDNLANQLLRHGYTFRAFSDGLPSVGFTGCAAGNTNVGWYARKHAPWTNFTNIPKSLHVPYSTFPTDLHSLPTVSFVIPNLKHDMHDGTVREADQWLHDNLDRYIKWTQNQNAMFVLTWDEDDNSEGNRIPLILIGSMVKPGSYQTSYNHFNLLRTIEDIYGLNPLGKSSNLSPFTGMWKGGYQNTLGK